MAEEFKIRVGTELDSSGLQKLKSEVNALDGKKIKFKADMSGVDSQINSIKKSLDGVKEFGIKQGSTDSFIGKSVSQTKRDYYELKRITSQMTSLMSTVARLEITPDLKESELAEARSQLNRLEDAYDSLRSNLENKLPDAMFDGIDSSISKAEDSVARLEARLEDIKRNKVSSINDAIDFNDYQAKIDNISSRISSLDKPSRGLIDANNRLIESYNELYSAQAKYNIENSVSNSENLVSAQNRFNDALRKTNNLLTSNRAAQREANNAIKQYNDSIKLENNKKVFSNQIDVWLKNNSAAAAQFGGKLREIQAQISMVDAAGLGNLQSEFRQVTQQAQLAGVATLTFGDRLKRQATEYASYFGIATVAFEGTQALQMMFQNVLDIDTAMTGLYRVTDLTADQYSALYDEMISSAKEYGSTLEDTINATADWVRAGFDAETALGLADVSAMYQHVSDLDYDEASDNLLTAYNGFKDTLLSTYGGDDVAAVEHIADVYNELDNNFSVTSAGLGEGISRAASALQLAGNTFEESTAMIGAVTEVTQDPEKAGNAMKILSLRLRGMKGELQELGVETDENVENLSKMQGQVLNLTKGKVNIFDDNGDFESTYDIMKGIAEVWDELSSTDQAQLLETIAGKDRANDVAALITNFADAEAMVTSALDSEGSATRENEKYLDSMQGKIDSLTTSFQALSQTTLNSDFLKGGISGITAFIDALGKLIDTFGLLPTLASTVAAALSFKGIGFTSIDKEEKNFKVFGKTISEVTDSVNAFRSAQKGTKSVSFLASGSIKQWNEFSKNLERDIKKVQELQKIAGDSGRVSQADFDRVMVGASESVIASMREYNAESKISADNVSKIVEQEKKRNVTISAQKKSMKDLAFLVKEFNNAGTGKSITGLSKNQLVDLIKEADASLGTYFSNVQKGGKTAQASFRGVIASITATKVAMLGLEAVSLAVNTAMTMGIGLAITAIVTAVTEWLNANEKLSESVADATSSFKQQHSELIKGKSSFEETAKSYAELSKGVDKLTGKNISLMPEEYEEYKNAANEIAETIPSLVAGYDEQGNAILNCAGDVDTLTEAYNNLIIAENNKLLNGDGEEFKGLSDIAKDLGNDFNKIKTKSESADGIEELLGIPSEEVTREKVAKIVGNITSAGILVKNALESSGIDVAKEFGINTLNWDKDDYGILITESIKKYPDIVRSAINDVNSELDSMTEEARTAMSTHMENAFLSGDYSNIDSEMQNIASSIVSSLDSQFVAELNASDGNTGAALTAYIDDMLSAINGMDSDAQEKLKSAFDLQGLFSTDEISLGEYKSQLEDAVDLIDSIEGLDDEVKTELKMSLNVDEVTSQYDTLVNRLKELGVEGAEEFVSGLNSSQLASAQELVVEGDIDWQGKTPEEITAEIQRMAEVAEASSFKIDIDAETEGLDNLNSALSESYSATGLTSESIENIKSRYSDLEGFNPAAIFEKTTTGVRLNEKALASLEEQYVKTKKAAADQQLDTLTEEYSRLTEEMKKASDAGDKDLANSYQAQLDDLSETIESAQLAAAAYDGLTSAYNNWINAQQQGQAGDIYDQIVSGRENAQTLADEGKWGNTELQGYVEMFSAPAAMDTATPEQYAAAWQSAIYKSNRYFTEGTEGIDNFISDVAAANSELVKMNENGEWEIAPNFDTKDWAEAAGVAESTVEAIFGQMSEYGFDVPIGINTDSVDKLVAESEAAVQSATEELQKYLGEDFSIDLDLNTDSFDTVDEKVNYIDGQLSELQSKKDEINNSDATVEVKQQGIDAVNMAIDAAIQKKIELSQPAFMSIDSSQVDASLSDALTKAQEMQNAINNLNILEEKQSYGIEVDPSEIENARQKIQECADAIQGLDGETKVAIGLEENGDVQSIIDSFNEGKVEIKVGSDTSEAEEKIDSLDDGKTIDLQVNLQNAEQVSDLESKLNAIDNKTITANVVVNNDGQIADLESKMNAIDNKTITANVVVNNDGQIADLESKMNAIDNKTITANVVVNNDGSVAALESKLNAIDNKTITANVVVNNSGAVDAIKASLDGIQSSSINVSVTAVGTETVYALQAAINAVQGKSIDVTANVNGTSEVNDLTAAIGRVSSKSVEVSASVWGTSSVNSLANAISSVQSKTVTITANYKKQGDGDFADGTANANGTAFADGTSGKAFKSGDWGTKDSGVALMGELGTETIVRDGKFFTVGEDGAGFYKYKKGDIIFNHNFLWHCLVISNENSI